MKTKVTSKVKPIKKKEQSYPIGLAKLCDLLIQDTEQRGVDRIVVTNGGWNVTIERIITPLKKK